MAGDPPCVEQPGSFKTLLHLLLPWPSAGLALLATGEASCSTTRKLLLSIGQGARCVEGPGKYLLQIVAGLPTRRKLHENRRDCKRTP